jgi:hypothetical protein
MESSEKKLKEKVLAMLKREFPDAWVYKTADRWKSGIPDVLICSRGRFFAAELKVGKNGATRLQRYTLEQIKRAGGCAAVCCSVDRVRELIKGGDLNDQGR